MTSSAARSPNCGLPSRSGNSPDVLFPRRDRLKGLSRRTFNQELSATLTPDVARQVGTNGLTYSSQFEVKTGGYAVRFVVRDNVTGRMRSVDSALACCIA